jgi:hypothetical protein
MIHDEGRKGLPDGTHVRAVMAVDGYPAGSSY